MFNSITVYMRAMISVGILFLTLAGAFPAAAQFTWQSPTARHLSPHFAVDSVAPGVWAVIHSDSGYASANAGIVDLGDATVVFDAFMTPEAAEDLRRVARELTGRPATYLVLSHWHNDHVRGAQAFPHTAILSSTRTHKLIGERDTRERAAEMRSVDAQLEAARKLLAVGVDTLSRGELLFWYSYFDGMKRSHPQLRLVLPTVTFDNRVTLRGSKRHVELIEVGGHTEGDVILWVPEEKVAFMSDVLFVRHHAYLPHGDARRHIEALRRVAALEPRVLIPGHGPVSGPESINELSDYIEWLLDQAGKLAAGNATEKEARANPMPSHYQSYWFRKFWGINNWILVQRARQ